MKGLLMKDFYNLAGQLKFYALFPLLAAFQAYMQHSFIILILLMAMMVISIPMSSFAYDDMSNFSSYALTLPITRKDIALSKFILSFLVSLCAIVMSIFLMWVLVQIFGASYFGNVDLIVQSRITIFAVFALNALNCFTLPASFKFGTEKSRVILIIAGVLAGGGFFLINKVSSLLPPTMLSSLLSFIENYGNILGVACLILIEVGMLQLSNHILSKKEF